MSFVAFLFMMLVLAWSVSQYSVDSAELRFPVLIKTSTVCATSALNNKNELIVFTPSQKIAKELSVRLCEDKVVAKQYGTVISHWGYKSSDSFEFAGKGLADLIFAKNNVMLAFEAQSTYNYQPVVGFLDYAAYFISAKEKPRLTKAYFLDKRIGLLDYPTSRSGHIIPKQVLFELGVNIDNLNIVYATTHTELRKMLANAKVDIIASFWKQSDSTRFSKNYITPISTDISGARWYFKMQHNNTDLLCAVQTHLLAISKAQPLDYYQSAQAYWQCNANSVELISDTLP